MLENAILVEVCLSVGEVRLKQSMIVSLSDDIATLKRRIQIKFEILAIPIKLWLRSANREDGVRENKKLEDEDKLSSLNLKDSDFTVEL